MSYRRGQITILQRVIKEEATWIGPALQKCMREKLRNSPLCITLHFQSFLLIRDRLFDIDEHEIFGLSHTIEIPLLTLNHRRFR